MERGQNVRMVLAVTGLALLVGGAALAAPPPQVRYFDGVLRPPLARLSRTGEKSDAVILVIVDALRPDHLGAYGYSRGTSPQLDALADQGLIFTNFFSDATWTRPSTASLFTGLPYQSHGCDAYRRLEGSVKTLAERFAAAGFATGAFLANPVVSSSYGLTQGFSHIVEPPLGSKARAWAEAQEADELVDSALAWIRGRADQRFFAVLFLIDVHDPWKAPAEWRKRFEPKRVPQRNVAREVRRPLSRAAQEGLLGAYDAEVAFTDHELGRFFGELDELGVLDRATVALTADHGDAFGEHKAYRHAFHMWDEVLRTPLLLRSPAFSERGQATDLPFEAHDLGPTLLDAAGLPVPEELSRHGVSILQALTDPDAYVKRDRILVHGVGVHGIRRAALRSRTGKLVVHFPTHEKTFLKRFGARSKVPSAVFGEEKHVYFHLLDDPRELAPLDPASHPEGRRLQAGLERRPGLLQLMRSPGVGSRELAPEVVEQLRALGY